MPQGNSVIHPYHTSFRTLHFALHIQQWRNHTTLHPSLQSKINLNARSWTLSTPGKRDEETSINTLHLFDLRCTWSKAEGNSACRIIYALFMEKHSSHDIADCMQRGMQQLHCVLAAAQFCRRAVSYRKRLDWLLLRKAQTTYLCDNVQQVLCHSYSTAKSKCVRELRCFRGVTSVQNPLNLISWIYTKLSFGPLRTKIKITSYYKVNTATVFTNSSLLQQRAQRLSLFFQCCSWKRR